MDEMKMDCTPFKQELTDKIPENIDSRNQLLSV